MIFQKKKKPYGLFAYTGMLIAVLLLFMISMERMEESSFEKSRQTLTVAAQRAAIHCYAIEGQYPENIEYLQRYYGLHYDEKRFFVHYELIGANLMPDIFVTGSEEFYEGSEK